MQVEMDIVRLRKPAPAQLSPLEAKIAKIVPHDPVK